MSAVRDASTGEWALEAGAVVLADGGVPAPSLFTNCKQFYSLSSSVPFITHGVPAPFSRKPRPPPLRCSRDAATQAAVRAHHRFVAGPACVGRAGLRWPGRREGMEGAARGRVRRTCGGRGPAHM